MASEHAMETYRFAMWVAKSVLLCNVVCEENVTLYEEIQMQCSKIIEAIT